ncbi:MAG TPA: hypothetical protein VGX23_09065 [Actinocrinis sp.]|nr:hypothetical protein [Actinocrinis sp.]
MALGLALTLGGATLAGCSGSSTPSASAPSTSAAAAATTSAAAPSQGSAADTQQITQNWEAFFNKATPLAQKAQYLQNGSQMGATIQQFASNPLVGQVSARVDSVGFTSPTQATVTYDILGPTGSPLLPNASGQAMKVNGTWVVADSSLCALLSLTGGKIPGCS